MEQIETCIISRSAIPNIDLELKPSVDKITYDKEGNLITDTPLTCSLYKTVDGETNKLSEVPAAYDVFYQLDDNQLQTYVLNSEINLNSFERQCVFQLVLQGEEDVVWDIKTITKEYTAVDGTDGKDGKSTPLIYPAGEFDPQKAANKEYVGTTDKAPYIFYNSDNNKGYYIAYGTPTEAPNSDNIITKDQEIDWTNVPEDAAK